jgi:hypothetical protein
MKKCHCEEGLAEWIMSYADMITILMAFFVVMYSMAGDKKSNPKTEATMASLRNWLGPTRNEWPMFRMFESRRLHTQFDKPAPPDRHRGATDNTQATVPQPDATHPDGVTIYLPLRARAINVEGREQLAKVLEHVSGKMNLIEIRGQSKRHIERQHGHTAETMEEVYRKCKLVLDFLVESGINPERLQIRIVRPESGPNETELAKLERDVQVDVFMLSQLLELQPGVKTRSLKSAKSTKVEERRTPADE